jgi:hypothetical protein
MQYLQKINLDTIVIVYDGVKHTNLLLSNIGLINCANGKIYKRQLNSGCYGYFINRKFKAESKLPKYPLTKIIIIKEKLPF